MWTLKSNWCKVAVNILLQFSIICTHRFEVISPVHSPFFEIPFSRISYMYEYTIVKTYHMNHSLIHYTTAEFTQRHSASKKLSN